MEKTTVLVVESEREVREMILVALRHLNHKPLTANDGKSALELLEKDKNICLVLLDRNLPDMDGMEVLTQIREFCEPPTVVMITGQLDREEATKALTAGAADYLAKPLDRDQLQNRLNHFLGAAAGVTGKRMAKRKTVNLNAQIIFKIIDITLEHVLLESTFPVKPDNIIFIESDMLCRKLDLPWEHRFSLKVISCAGEGNSYRLTCSLKGLTTDIRQRIRSLCQSDGWRN